MPSIWTGTSETGPTNPSGNFGLLASSMNEPQVERVVSGARAVPSLSSGPVSLQVLHLYQLLIHFSEVLRCFALPLLMSVFTTFVAKDHRHWWLGGFSFLGVVSVHTL